jgi:hypothetical protein
LLLFYQQLKGENPSWGRMYGPHLNDEEWIDHFFPESVPFWLFARYTGGMHSHERPSGEKGTA